MEIALPNLASMNGLGEKLAPLLRPGDVVALSGGLGAGKTTLARAILRGLGYSEEVPSPSFTIIECYDPPQTLLPVVHADFYRLKNPDEIYELGLDDYRDGAAMIAEWPEYAGGFAHEAACLSIQLEIADDKVEGNGRLAIVSMGADWLSRIDGKLP